MNSVEEELKSRYTSIEGLMNSRIQESRMKELINKSTKVLKENVHIDFLLFYLQNQFSDRILMLEGEKSQLQSQISNLNASVITMKEELSHHSDEMLEKDRTLREKEQVIAELGTMIKTLQANIVFVLDFD